MPLQHSESWCIWPTQTPFGGRTSSVSAQLCCTLQLGEFHKKEPNQSTGEQLPAEALSRVVLGAYHNFTCICRNWCSETQIKRCWCMVFLDFSLRHCKILVHAGSFMSWDGLKRWLSLSDCWSKELLVFDLQILVTLWGMFYQKLGHSDKALSFKQLLKNDSFNCCWVVSLCISCSWQWAGSETHHFRSLGSLGI